MGDADKGDTTQPLSASQVLAVSKQNPSKPKIPKVAKNDQSAWQGLVVGADEFAPAPAKRSRAKWAIAGVLGVGGVGGGLYAAGVLGGGSRPPQAQPQAETTTRAPVPTPSAVTAQTPTDAAVAVAAIDAGLAAPPTSVDAISSAAPPLKPTKTTATKKKPAGKKRGH